MASTSLAVIRTLTIRAKTEGVDQAAASLGQLSKSQEQVAQSASKQEKATLSVDASLQKLSRRYDTELRAQQDLARAQQTLARAREAGLISQERQGQLMQLAIRHHNTAGDAARKQSQALQELSTVSQGLSGNLGTIGGILARMGPAGLAAAGVFGGLALAMTAAATAALGLADHAGKLVDLSDSIGITVTGLQALQEAASQVGVSEEQLSTQLERFSSVLGNLRDSNKGAIETFDRLGEGFAQQVASATSFEDALNLVYAQVNKLDTAAKSAALKELFGKGAAGQGRIAQLIADAQGIQGFLAQMDKAGILTRKQAEEFDKLGDSINRAFKVAGLNFVQSFAGPVLGNLKELTTQLLAMSKIAGGIAAPLAQAFGGDILTKITSLRDAMTDFAASLEGLTQAQKVQAVLDNLIDPRLIQFFKDLGQAIVDLITLIGQLATAMGQLVTLNFSGALSSVQAGIASFDQLKTSISNLGTTLTTEGTRGAQALSGVNVEAQDLDKTIGELVGGIPKDLGLKPEMAAPLKPVKLAFDDVGKSAGRAAKTIKEEVNPVLQELGQVAGQLGSALVTAFLNGDSAAKALNQTLKSVASSATSSAITKLVSGDFAGAAVSGLVAVGSAIGSFLFGDDDDEDQAAQQQAAEDAARARQAREEQIAAAQIRAADYTLRAAEAIEKSDFINTIRRFDVESQAAFDAESKLAGDIAIFQLVAARAAERTKLIADTMEAATTTLAGTELSEVQERLNEIADAGRDLGAALEALGQSADASITAMAEAVFRLADSTFGITQPLSEVQQQLSDFAVDAAALEAAFVQLGYSAEAAAAIVDGKLNVALAKMAGDFLDPIIRSINAFVGGDWINEAADLLAEVTRLRADATALGLDTALIQTYFVLAARDIINENQLVGDSFNRLVQMLGLADAGLKQFSAAVEDATDVIVRSAQEIANAIQANEDRLFLAIHRSDSLADQLARFDLAAQREREEEIRAGGQALASLERALAQERINIINDFNQQQLEAQQEAARRAAEEAARVRREQIEAAQRAAEERARVLKEATDFIKSQVRRINDWINNFLSGEQSILKPSQQMATARSHFASELSLAASGNRDALSNITTSAQQVVDSVRRYYGSSAAGQAIIQQLLTSLRTLPGQLSPEEFIVQGLTPPINNIPPAVVPPIVGGIIDQTTVLQALLNNLKIAIQTGDAQATAIALLPLFDKLDTTMDGALSFQELVQGLGSTFSSGTLRQIFTELDGNGNGLLEKSELIKAATQGTKNATDESNDLLQTTISRIAAGTAETVLWLKNIWDKINILIQQIIDGVRAPLMTIAAWAPGSSHAMGGWITGGVPGRDSVSARLMPGEFVVKESIARNNPWLEGFNQTGMFPAANDNGNVTAAIGRLERSLLRGFKALIETELEAAGIIAKPAQEANKLTRTRRGEKKKVA